MKSLWLWLFVATAFAGRSITAGMVFLEAPVDTSVNQTVFLPTTGGGGEEAPIAPEAAALVVSGLAITAYAGYSYYTSYKGKAVGGKAATTTGEASATGGTTSTGSATAMETAPAKKATMTLSELEKTGELFESSTQEVKKDEA